MPAQRGVCRGRQRIPRIHHSVLPPSLCGAASVRRMLHQRGLLLHQHEPLACKQDCECWVLFFLSCFYPVYFHVRHFSALELFTALLHYTAVLVFSALTPQTASRSRTETNLASYVTNSPVSHPALLQWDTLWLRLDIKTIQLTQSRTVAQSCNRTSTAETLKQYYCDDSSRRNKDKEYKKK